MLLKLHREKNARRNHVGYLFSCSRALMSQEW